jgi:hypothetical protein
MNPDPAPGKNSRMSPHHRGILQCHAEVPTGVSGEDRGYLCGAIKSASISIAWRQVKLRHRRQQWT